MSETAWYTLLFLGLALGTFVFSYYQDEKWVRWFTRGLTVFFLFVTVTYLTR